MAKYVLSRKAISDLVEIWQYSCSTWSEMQADKYYELLTGAFLSIAMQPALGKSYEEISAGLLGMRMEQHIIFYRMSKVNHIQIIRVLHVRMDLDRTIKA
jgi:toxin ParE1/3/4